MKRTRLTVRQLSIIAALAKHKRIDDAAESVHMASASFYNSVRASECILGYAIFSKDGRWGDWSNLTVKGKRVVKLANKLLAIAREIEGVVLTADLAVK